MALSVNPGRIIPSMPWRLQFFSGVNGERFTLAPQDGDRAAIAFVFQPPLGAIVNCEWRIMPGTDAQTDRGWTINNSTNRLLFRFADYGPLVCQAWNGLLIETGMGGIYSIGVYTFRFQPRVK